MRRRRTIRLEAAPDEGSRKLLASALHVSSEVNAGPEHEFSAEAVVESALRDVAGEVPGAARAGAARVQMAEASAATRTRRHLLRLAQQKMELDRERRGLDQSAA